MSTCSHVPGKSNPKWEPKCSNYKQKENKIHEENGASKNNQEAL